MALTQNEITAELQQNLGIAPGDMIVVHSSLKSLGRVEGGAEAFIRALLDAIGGAAVGTLMMPCFTDPADEIDLRTTPCRLGLVPETFRTMPGVIRSVNHTHSVAVIGREADALVQAHENTTPLGKDSPFHELAKRGGYVVHVGCGLTSSSIIHVAEAIAGLPPENIAYPEYDREMTLILPGGRKRICLPKENPGCSSHFDRVQTLLDKDGKLTHGSVGAAAGYKARGDDILAAAARLLDADPEALLCDREKCPVCPRKRTAMRMRKQV